MASIRLNRRAGQKLCVYLLLLCLLAACGWRLRGTGVDATNLPPLHLQGDDLRFVSELEQAFSKLGFKPIAKENAQWEINIKNHKLSRRLSAVNQSGQATSFLLSLTIQFNIYKINGSEDTPAQVVTASQDILYDQTAVLGKDAEEKIIQESLLGDTAQQIIYRYRALVRR